MQLFRSSLTTELVADIVTENRGDTYDKANPTGDQCLRSGELCPGARRAVRGTALDCARGVAAATILRPGAVAAGALQHYVQCFARATGSTAARSSRSGGTRRPGRNPDALVHPRAGGGGTGSPVTRRNRHFYALERGLSRAFRLPICDLRARKQKREHSGRLLHPTSAYTRAGDRHCPC